MPKYDWRPVRDLELTEPLIPDPNASHQMLSRFREVRVAIEGSFLHIDVRPETEQQPGGEFTVYTVPASAVRIMHTQHVTRSNSLSAY